MAKTLLLLSDVYMALQERGLELGIGEYLIALRVLAESELVSSRQDLIVACQLIWAKSPQEQQLVAQTLDIFLPPRLETPEMMNWLEEVHTHFEKELLTSAEPANNTQASVTPARLKSNPARLGPGLELPFELAATVPLLEVSDPPVATPDAPTQPVTSVPTPAVSAGTAMEIKGHFTPDKLSQEEDEDDEDKYIFEVELPVPDRQIRQAWRKLRRLGRRGPAVELDVEATVSQFSQRGGWVSPVLRPRLQNEARLLILVDEGGSMVPFRPIIQPLLEAIRQSGLAQVKIVYFHNVPGREVFEDQQLQTLTPLEGLITTPFTPHGILIVSDGGAARHRFNEQRLEQTLEILGWLRNYTSRLVWLNPLPPERWQGSTAGVLARGRFVPMFGLEREGLIRCVATLQRAGN